MRGEPFEERMFWRHSDWQSNENEVADYTATKVGDDFEVLDKVVLHEYQ